MKDLELMSREEIAEAWSEAAAEAAYDAQTLFCREHSEFANEANAFALIQVLIRQARQAGQEPEITPESLKAAWLELTAEPDLAYEYCVSGIGGNLRWRLSAKKVKELAEQSGGENNE